MENMEFFDDFFGSLNSELLNSGLIKYDSELINLDIENSLDNAKNTLEKLNLSKKQIIALYRKRKIEIFNVKKQTGKISYKNMDRLRYKVKSRTLYRYRDKNGRFTKNKNKIKFVPITKVKNNIY